MESKTESKFCLRWGSQKSEAKVGIPNQAMALTVKSVADGNTDMAANNAVINTVLMNLVTYLGLMGAWTTANRMLFDIPQRKEEMMKQFAVPTNL